MQTKQIDILNTVYAVNDRGTGLGHHRIARGVVLSRIPWRSRQQGREQVWYADPQGKGYGEIGVGYRANFRGVLVLVVSEFGRDRDEVERLAAELPQVAAGIAPTLVDRDRGPRPESPEGYSVVLRRPQNVVATWAEKLEHDRIQREREQAARKVREERDAVQDDARAELIKLVGSGSIPFMSGTKDYVKLLAFAEKFHQAKLTQLGEAIAELENESAAEADRVDYDGLFRTREGS